MDQDHLPSRKRARQGGSRYLRVAQLQIQFGKRVKAWSNAYEKGDPFPEEVRGRALRQIFEVLARIYGVKRLDRRDFGSIIKRADENVPGLRSYRTLSKFVQRAVRAGVDSPRQMFWHLAQEAANQPDRAAAARFQRLAGALDVLRDAACELPPLPKGSEIEDLKLAASPSVRRMIDLLPQAAQTLLDRKDRELVQLISLALWGDIVQRERTHRLKVSPGRIKIWNAVASLSPNEFVAQLRAGWNPEIEGGMPAREMESREERTRRLAAEAQGRLRQRRRRQPPAAGGPTS